MTKVSSNVKSSNGEYTSTNGTTTNDRSLIDEIKRKLTIKQVMDKFGGAELSGDGDKLTGRHKAHESKSNASLHVDNKDGVYHCFNCGQGGDIFSWLGHERHNSSYSDRNKDMFGGVLRELAAFAGVELPSYNPETAADRRSIEEIWQIAANFYHGELTDEHRAFLHSRYGLTDETIDALKIGYAPPSDTALLAHLIKGHKIEGVELVRSGLFQRFDSGDVQDFFQGRYIFPYWKGSRVCYFIGRITDESPQWERDAAGMKYKKLLVHNAKHHYVSEQVRNDYFYGEDAARGANELFVTEGITDAIIANQYGFPCISPVTVQFRKADWPHLLDLVKGIKTLYLANDNETNEAGKKGALATAEMLWVNGHRAKMVTLPRSDGVDKVDLNDFLREQGPEAFRAVLTTSKNLLDLRIEAFATASNDDERIEARRAVIGLIAYINDKHALLALAARLPKALDMGKQDYNRLVKAATEELAAKATEVAEAAEAKVREEKTKTREAAEAVEAAAEDEERRLNNVSVIHVNNRQLDELRDDAIAAIACKNGSEPTVFVRGGALVRILEDELQKHGINELNNGATLSLLSTVADWLTVEEKGGKTVVTNVHPPQNVVNVVINDGAWPGLPGLTGVVTSPVFSADGTLHDQPGYNPKTKLYYTGGVTLGDTTPTPANIESAKALILDDLLGDFPFKDDASSAHSVAYALLPIVRDMIPGPTPVHDVDSPTPGTGKGKLLEACAMPFLGHSVPTMAATQDDDEWRKRITTSLMDGSTHIVIDNVKHELDSGILASAFTQPVWEDRTLGSNRMVKIPIRTVWGITANNIKMSQEIARRCLWIRLDANAERPWERTGFKHKDLIAWASEHRNELVTALITLVRAWVEKGMPKYTDRTKGSYEAWAGVMGGILSTVGVVGFLANENELYERVVSKSNTLVDFVRAWWDKYGGGNTSGKDLFRLASFADSDEENAKGGWKGLLDDVLTSSKQRGRETQLGNILTENRDKVIGQYKITHAGIVDGRTVWKLLDSGPTGSGPVEVHYTDSTILPQENDAFAKDCSGPSGPSPATPCSEVQKSIDFLNDDGDNKKVEVFYYSHSPTAGGGPLGPLDSPLTGVNDGSGPVLRSTTSAVLSPTVEDPDAENPFDDGADDGEVTTWTY